MRFTKNSWMSVDIWSCILVFGLSLTCNAIAQNTVTNNFTDSGKALINPGMGLVHYHYSNRLWAYGMYSKPGDTDPLPGTSVVYLRVL